MELIIKLHNGRFEKINTNYHIGDYVKIWYSGYQYPSYATAFQYFWGTYVTTDLEKNELVEDTWKIMNFSVHADYSSLHTSLLIHIRNRKGDNVVISENGIRPLNFHKRNREPIHTMVIYPIPKSMMKAEDLHHTWKSKLWDYYEDGEIVKNKRRKS